MKKLTGSIALFTILAASAQAASVTLYDQDFESPAGFVNGAGSGYKDVSQQEVNDLYLNQPTGFAFAQQNSVETILLTGNGAFGTGYSDPAGQGGNYSLGMLSVADDRLGLSFDAGSYQFFNFRFDFSSLGLDGSSGPFANATTAPAFRISVFDNPTAVRTIGSGTVLDFADISGTASALDTLDWTTGLFAFDISGSTNGNVTLQLDLLSGGYAAFDNFRITASDTPGGGLSPVPLPAALPLLGLGLGVLGFAGARRRRNA